MVTTSDKRGAPAFMDAAADAVAREIASFREEARKQLDRQEAEHRAFMVGLERALSAPRPRVRVKAGSATHV